MALAKQVLTSALRFVNSASSVKLHGRAASTYKAAVLHEVNAPLTIDNIKPKKLKKGEVRPLLYLTYRVLVASQDD